MVAQKERGRNRAAPPPSLASHADLGADRDRTDAEATPPPASAVLAPLGRA